MTLDVGRAGTWRRTHPAEKVQKFGANLDPGSLLESADGAKWWSTAPIDRVVLRRSDGSGLEVRWDGIALPCVALWLDPGAYASSPVIAIEPALAPFDSLADAASAAAAPTVSRSHPLRWWIRLREIGAPASSSDSARPTGDANHWRATG
ncbi:hypothetical protein RN51_01729 [Microbacterium oxydans]|uniref:Uncharacterized protein n=1 Tax=Microbacterium oxydans TaxID=82380 RepID=A0A0F0KQ28_9MICO|nr:hypothetical protein [Microbacterium oxydans]KJL22983.1 hypothetical protein RN51_01729 [Microbacterium oxydans]